MINKRKKRGYFQVTQQASSDKKFIKLKKNEKQNEGVQPLAKLRNLPKSLVFSSVNKTPPVYTGPVKFLNGRILYLSMCNQFIRNPANFVTDYSTVCCSKTCTVPRVPCKRKVDPCKFLSVQKFVRTRVNGVL